MENPMAADGATTTTTVIPRPEEMMAAMYANLSQLQAQNSYNVSYANSWT